MVGQQPSKFLTTQVYQKWTYRKRVFGGYIFDSQCTYTITGNIIFCDVCCFRLASLRKNERRCKLL